MTEIFTSPDRRAEIQPLDYSTRTSEIRYKVYFSRTYRSSKMNRTVLSSSRCRTRAEARRKCREFVQR